MMKPCQPVWRFALLASFLLGYCVNPILAISGIEHNRYIPLIGVAFSGLFFLMILLAVPGKKAKPDGRKEEGGEVPRG